MEHLLYELMKNPDNIRIVATIAHIDHGKTTFTDVLIAEAGILAPELIGIRYLDFLEEEQRRGITIKTAAISLVVKAGKEKIYLLNLIDTPGHVDFSGKVTRALRLADGAIVIVDAVEGIMSQTEYVLRSALEEYVRPILFINKVDRLIDELSLSETDIMKVFSEIISEFNELIDIFAVDDLQKKWKVAPKEESVVFGSALQRWGLTVPEAMRKNVKFREILRLYHEDRKKLLEEFPLGKLMTRVIYEKLPSPSQAQKYRLPKLCRGEILSEAVRCDKKGSTFAYIGKVQVSNGDVVAFGRIFSGELKRGKLWRLPIQEPIKIHAIYVPIGERLLSISSVSAGMIFAAKMPGVKPGDTISDKRVTSYFRGPHYLVQPVIAVAIEPENIGDYKKMLKELELLILQDPDLFYDVNEETGEVRLYGVGELHLELALKELNKRVKARASKPIVILSEIPSHSISVERYNLHVKLEPAYKEQDNIIIVESRYDFQVKGLNFEEKQALLKVLKSILRVGKKGGSITGLKMHIIVKGADIREVFSVISEVFTKLETKLVEPLYLFDIITAPEFIGDVQAEIRRRRGEIKDMIPEFGKYIKIVGIIPVKESLGLISKLRSIAHGKIFVQLKFHGFRKITSE